MQSAIIPGKISSVDYKNGCADVVFDGMDGNVKAALPFLSFEYSMPQTGDMVLVAFQQYKNREQGFIIGRYYNSSNIPPEGLGKGDYYKRFSENTFLKYDAKNDTLSVTAGGININADIKSGILTLSAKKVLISEG